MNHSRDARWEIVTIKSGPTRLVIRDLGPWEKHLTVTNDVESVVQKLVAQGLLKPGMQLLYYDSEGELDEIKVVDGKFAGFAPWPRRS